MLIDTSLSDEELKIRSGSFTVGRESFEVATRQAYVEDGQHHAAYVEMKASAALQKFAALPDEAAGKSVSGESAQQALRAMGMNTQQAQAVERVTLSKEGNQLNIQFKEHADAALVADAQMRVIEQAVQKNILPRESLLALSEAEILPIKKTIGVEFNDFGDKVTRITIPNTENATGHELRVFVHPDGQVTVHTGAQHKTREVLGDGERQALAQVGKALGVPQEDIQRMVNVDDKNPLRQVNTDKSVPEILQSLESHKMLAKGTAAQVAEFVAQESVSMEHVVKLKDAKQAVRDTHRSAGGERAASSHETPSTNVKATASVTVLPTPSNGKGTRMFLDGGAIDAANNMTMAPQPDLPTGGALPKIDAKASMQVQPPYLQQMPTSKVADVQGYAVNDASFTQSPPNAVRPVNGHGVSAQDEHYHAPNASASKAAPSHASHAGKGAGIALGVTGIAQGMAKRDAEARAGVGDEQLAARRDALLAQGTSVAGNVSEYAAPVKALKTLGKSSAFIAAGAAALEIRAAHAAQDGHGATAAATGFVGVMVSGVASGAVGGASFGPWGAVGGGVVGGVIGGYIGSEAGRGSGIGKQLQYDWDVKAQAKLDADVDVLRAIKAKETSGAALSTEDKNAVSVITIAMKQHAAKMEVLDLPANDTQARLRVDAQKHQAQHVVEYFASGGKSGALETSAEIAQRNVAQLESVAAAMSKPALNWTAHLDSNKNGKVDKEELVAALNERKIPLNGLDKGDGVVTAQDVSTELLKAGKGYTGRPVASTVEDAVHPRFSNGLFHRDGDKAFDAALQSVLPALNKEGLGAQLGDKDGVLTVAEIKDTMKKYGISVAQMDKDVSGTLTPKEVRDTLALNGALNSSTVHR